MKHMKKNGLVTRCYGLAFWFKRRFNVNTDTNKNLTKTGQR